MTHNRNSILPLNDGRSNGPTGVIVAVAVVTCFVCLGAVEIELLGDDAKKLLAVAEMDLGDVGERSSLEPHS